jgi:regulator of protease activity HflC (stomatin/prohibitin superfamily)
VFVLIGTEDQTVKSRRSRRRDPRPWPYRRLTPRGARLAGIATIAAFGVVILLLVTGATFSRQDSGHVGVVRNGGPLDNRGIRQILMPGQRVTWTGMFSQAPREYPAARVVLVYTVTSDLRRGDRREVDVVNVPTKDGVQVGLQGTVFYHFVGDRNTALLRRFDQTFGTRKFPEVGGSSSLYPWKGEDGWAAMLDAAFRPVLDNDLRQEVGNFRCADLVASCSLVHRVAPTAADNANANANVAEIQERLNRSLTEDLTDTLGGAYFWGVRVRLARVTLPPNVQEAVDHVQAQYVGVNGAKAQVTQAHYEAKRNELLSRAYNHSPALAQIDAIKAAPKGATIVLNSGGNAAGINVGGG